MNKALVIISVSDRVDDLNKLVRSIRSREYFDDYDLCLCYQDYMGNSEQIENPEQYATLLVEPEKMGCNGARIHLLNHIEYDVYVNLDDDMLMTDFTNYEPAIELAMEETTGFVLTNWARSEKILNTKIPNMKDEFVKQVMIYQGGGMIYSNKIAEIIRELPIMKTVFDDVWPITAYVNGYVNYRYLGSLTLHFTLGDGGMQTFMREETDLQHSAEDYINYRKGKREGEWLIPMDSDINDKAHMLHRLNRVKNADD